MAIENFMGDWEILVPDRIPDGEGGFTTNGWKSDVPIKMAAVRDTTMSARTAEKEGVTSVWTVTTKKGVILPYHTVLRCLSDDRIATGTILRTTSKPGEMQTPSFAGLNMSQVTAESWELTT